MMGGVSPDSELEARRVTGALAEAFPQRGKQEWHPQGRSQEKVVRIEERAASPGQGQGYPQGETQEEQRTK